MKILQKKAGFTLIEMMVTIAIIVVLSGLGIASFIGFNERQQVGNAAKQVQHMFRTGQSKARVKEMPTGCDALLSYEVYRVSGGVISLRPNCENGDKTPETWAVPSGITVAPASFSVKFKTLHGAANISGGSPLIISVSNTDNQYNFEVTAGGEITQGSFAP